MKRNFKLLMACVAASILLAACHKPEEAPLGNQPLDYALQVIPDIHEVMPMDLIMAMGEEHLYFGDTPPKIDLPFYKDSLYLTQFIHNIDIDTSSTYYKEPSYYTNRFTFAFLGQHRGVFDTMEYVRDYHYEAMLNTYFHEYAIENKDIFIMGHAPYFTAYFKQVIKREVGNTALAAHITDYTIEMTQSTIISGKVTPTGISDFRMGVRIEDYNYTSPSQGVSLPELHDMFIYDASGLMPYDTAYNNIHRIQ